MEVRLGYKQTEVGVIPEDWEVKTLFELAERKKEFFDDGDWIESEHITTQGIRLIQTGNIGVGRFIEKDDKKYIYESSFTSLKCKLLEQGDLLVCRLADPAGRACVLTDIGEGRIVTSVDVTIFRPPSELADRLFLVQIFSTSDWFKAVSGRSGGTTHKRISRGALGRLSIGLPPLPEQRAIATALSDVDALLGSLERLIAKKRDLKQAAMQQLLTGQTRLPGFHGEWELKRLGSLGAFLKGSGVRKDEALSGDLPCVRYGEIYTHHHDVVRVFNTFLSSSVASAATPLRKGDLLFAASGETKEEIGKAVAFAHDYEAYAGGDIVILRPEASDSVFLGYYLNSPPIQKQKASRGQGDAVVHISATSLAAIEVTVPFLPEQTAIATVLTDMDAELAALTHRLTKTRALKQGMMQELLTGRTRLVAAEDAS